ncbi:hypothetical protein [Enterocloster sp.]|uniref:hypothetical protein n=1 Tax=Enterocloster sp. TaxID=2719315 RepID=UPI0039A156B2
MKRKLRNCLAILTGLSLFFTGCKNQSVNLYMETLVPESASPPQRPVETTGTPASLPDVEKEVGEQASVYLEQRFQELTGPRAFFFPENHSLSHTDIKVFQVLGLLEGRFYYYYVTKEINSGQEVHALASYEYETERYKSLYENKVDPGAAGTDTDSQYSFYGHLAADKLGRLRISLYDGGNLFILDGEGKAVFSRTSEDEGEDFLYLIDSIFGVGGTNPSYFSKDITNVTTNGRYCFYVPITLYKGDYTKEEEIGEEEYILQYTYSPIGAGTFPNTEYLLQEDLNWNQRVLEWKAVADSGNSERDPEEDWKDALKKYPEKWGPYYVSTGYDWAPTFLYRLMEWKNQKFRNFVEGKKGISTADSKENEGYAELFAIPAEESIFTDVWELKTGQNLMKFFFLSPGEGYCPLVGKVGQRSDILKTETRTYTITKTNSKGESEEIEIEDEIQAVIRRKALFAEGAAVEQFYVLDNKAGIGVTAGPVWRSGNYSMGINIGPILLCIDYFKDQTANEAVFFPAITEWERMQMEEKYEGNLSFCILGGRAGDSYPMAHNLEKDIISIYAEDGKYITIKTDDLNASGYGQTSADQELLSEVEKRKEYREEKGFNKNSTYKIDKENAYTNPDRYGRDNILVIKDGDSKNLLFTSFYNGMLYFETERYSMSTELSSGKGYHLSEWTLYQAWQTGEDEITCIGFQRTDAVYYYMDMAMARVYKLSLKEFKEQAASYQIPVERKAPPENEAREPSLDEGVTLPAIPQDMERIKQDIKENSIPPTSSASREEMETLPDVTITETGAVGDRMWKDAQERMRGEE